MREVGRGGGRGGRGRVEFSSCGCLSTDAVVRSLAQSSHLDSTSQRSASLLHCRNPLLTDTALNRSEQRSFLNIVTDSAVPPSHLPTSSPSLHYFKATVLFGPPNPTLVQRVPVDFPRKPNPPTEMLQVFHLENSRSQRIVWLLEELEIPYELHKFQRQGGVAGPDFK
jgi:hypothetical protein